MAQIAAQTCEFSCDEVAVLYCKGCDQFLCVECRQNLHDRVRKFKDHEVVNIHKEGNRVRPNPLCETHENQFLYYCSKCECLTCAECMTSSHNEHKTEKIKNVADARRQNVNQIIEQLKTKVETVKKKLETIDTEHSIQIKSDYESYVKIVEETVDDLHTIVGRHKLIPMTTASDFKDIENEDLGRKRSFFISRHDETANRLLKFEKLMQETHDSTFLTEWKSLQTDVKMNDEETDDPLVAPRRIESFNQKKLTRSVIDEIDEKFQMRLKEQEQTVVRLTEEMDALKTELKEKQMQIDDLAKLSRELKEMKTKVTELMDENDKLNTEIKERKLQEFSKQQGGCGRRRRKIDTDPDYQSENKPNSLSNDMNASLGRSTSVTSSSSTSPQDMVYKTPEGLVIKVYVGNILQLNVDCIVNAANENLFHGGGVADVISRSAGYGFQQESDDYIQRNGQLMVTECCTTSAGSLPYRCVIHAVGPKWYDYPFDKKKCASDLKKTIVNCFLKAETQQVNSVALPTISSGIFGVPKEVCCRQYYEAVIDYSVKHSGKSSSLKEIQFIDKDSGMVTMIQDEFGQQLIITNATKSYDNKDLKNAGQNSSQDKKGRLEWLLSNDPDDGKENLRTRAEFSLTITTDNFKCQFFVDNGLKIHVVEEDITKMNVDVVVCPQDGMCQSKGGIAKAIERVSDEQYKKKMYGMRQINKCEVRRYMASPEVLPFKNVIHAVSPLFDNNAAKNRDNFKKELALTIRNVLRNCMESSVLQTIAIPVLGVGVEKNVTPYGIYASTIAKEILKLLQSEKFMLKEIYIVTLDPDVASSIAINLEGENAFKRITSFQRHRRRQNKDSTERQKADDGNGAKTKSSDKLGTTVREGNLDDCVICMDKPEDPRKLKCGHIFCQGCIGEHFKLNNPGCPTCGSIQGELTGNQPPGTMKVYKCSSSLSGYPRCGRIVIDYDIPGGYQGKEHKTPGRSYEGIRRRGYLPDNEKGQLVAKMLLIAFDRKMVFTIGDSRTTGKQGVVTWNDIHHKTNPNPHGQFGYPDETYLDRVIDELSAKGVSEKDVGPDTKLY